LFGAGGVCRELFWGGEKQWAGVCCASDIVTLAHTLQALLEPVVSRIGVVNFGELMLRNKCFDLCAAYELLA
jgi:hypothetical protein